MPKTIPTTLATKKNLVNSTDSWVHLIQVQIDDTEAVRITDHDAAVIYGGYTYSPYPVSIGKSESTTEGKLGTVDVTVSNVGRLVTAYLEAGKIVGQRARIYIANTATVGAGTHPYADFEVMSADVTAKAALFRLGLSNLLGVPFPGERWLRTRCRFLPEYGSGRCGYDTTLSNQISGTYPSFDPAACDGTLEGSNGCRAHGANEVAHSAPRLHPARYGGAPGIVKGPILV